MLKVEAMLLSQEARFDAKNKEKDNRLSVNVAGLNINDQRCQNNYSDRTPNSS